METETPSTTIGEMNYTAYRSELGGRTWDDRPMPAWADLPANIRAGWEAGARFVRRHTLAEITVLLEQQGLAVAQAGEL